MRDQRGARVVSLRLMGIFIPAGGGAGSCRPVSTSSRSAASTDGSPLEPLSVARVTRPVSSAQIRTITDMFEDLVLLFRRMAPLMVDRTWSG